MILEGSRKLRIQICNNPHLVLFQWILKAIYFGMQWINMASKSILVKTINLKEHKNII